MSEHKDCTFCKNFDFESKKCKYLGNDCLTVGSSEYTFKHFEEISPDEKDRRQYLIEVTEIKQKLHSEQLQYRENARAAHALLLISEIIIVLLISAHVFAHNLAHPELTRMQLLFWSLSKPWHVAGYIYCLVALVVSYFLLKID